MNLSELRTFDEDDLTLVKLCLKLNLLSEEQLENLLQQNAGKQTIFVICDSGLLNSEQVSELLNIKKRSIICPHCQAVNILSPRENYPFCTDCHQSIRPSRHTSEQTGIHQKKYGKYKILEEIGNGSVGIVYKARHEQLDRFVALKVLKTEAITEHSLLRFKQEAKTAASLNHPAIVAIYDVGEEHGEYYIAMEYIQGKNLAHYIQEKKPPMKKKVEIVMKIAHGLQHAHENGIIHRDIKPENIMITDRAEVKITDFSVARHIKHNVKITQENMTVGTPIYMSPEQITGEVDLGPSTDIYSLGVVFYEMLVGHPPFDHNVTDTLLQKILSEKPIPPTKIKAGIPIMLENICLKAMAKKKSERFAAAKDMYLALKQFMAVDNPAEKAVTMDAKAKEKPHIAATSQHATSDENSRLETTDENSRLETTDENSKLESTLIEPSNMEFPLQNITTTSTKVQPTKPSYQELMLSNEDEGWSTVDFILWGSLGLAVLYLGYQFLR